MKLPLVCLAWLGIASALPAQAACYTVYLGSRIAYRSTTPPVDLSRPYSETLPPRFGSGASMITTVDETGCVQVVLSGGAPPEGISRGASAARGERSRSSGTAKPRASDAPASLDAVFVDPSLQMRSSVGVSEAASASNSKAKVQQPSSLLPPPPSPPPQ
jgi:hypothetical protein